MEPDGKTGRGSFQVVGPERSALIARRDMTESPDASGTATGHRSRYPSREVKGLSLVTRRIAGETILVPVTGGVADLHAVYTLNDVGSFIWHLIDGRRTAQAIADAVSSEYDVTVERAAEDVDELLTALEANGLVALSTAPWKTT